MSKQLIYLDITEDDILHGDRLSSNSCPIARSLTRALGSNNSWDVSIHPRSKLVWLATAPGAKISIGGPLPARTATFINRWDTGKKVEPCSLALWLGR